MTSGFNLTPEPLETLLHLLQGKQEGLAALQQRRELVADELRSLDRDLGSLEAQIRNLCGARSRASAPLC